MLTCFVLCNDFDIINNNIHDFSNKLMHLLRDILK
jgi:hypothetical protein